MKLTDYREYEIHLPTSGGKAGKGCNRTSSVQVRWNNQVLVQIRYLMADPDDYEKALRKAKEFVDRKVADKERMLARYFPNDP